MKFYMFRAAPLSIIMSFSLYTLQWYMSYIFADNLQAGLGWNLEFHLVPASKQSTQSDLYLMLYVQS
jgi:hypothetical protein